MAVVLETHEAYLAHDTGYGHPERPARLQAVLSGIGAAGVAEAVIQVSPRAATREELERVHPAAYLDAIERFCASGGGSIDADTVAYLSLEGLLSAVGNERSSYCSSCYTGRYPVAIPQDQATYLQLALKLDKTEPVAK